VSRTGQFPKEHAGQYVPTALPYFIRGVNLSTDRSTVKQDGSGYGGLKIDDIATQLFDEWNRVKANGIHWISVTDSIRLKINDLWMCLSTEERIKFHEQWRDTWEIHRHRVAPGHTDVIKTFTDNNQLQMFTGKLTSIKHTDETDGDSTAVVTVVTSNGEQKTTTVDWVINCTGPQLDYRNCDDPLISQMRTDKLLLPEASGVAMLVDVTTGALLSPSLVPSNIIYSVGPPRKVSEWETIGVWEIRTQSDIIAKMFISDSEKHERG
jgi:uncharacterized NAD(P)/FAD-binding protein YdhS